MILSNQVECLLCGDKPYSAHRHDFKFCSCKSLSVDGGMDYCKRVFDDRASMREMSIIWEDELVEDLMKNIEEALLTGRNSLGIVCAVARTLRDNGYKLEEADDGKVD